MSWKGIESTVSICFLINQNCHFIYNYLFTKTHDEIQKRNGTREVFGTVFFHLSLLIWLFSTNAKFIVDYQGKRYVM